MPPKSRKRQSSKEPHEVSPKTSKSETFQADSPSTSVKCETGIRLQSLLTQPEWKMALVGEFQKHYWSKLEDQLHARAKDKKLIYPPRQLIFFALNQTPLSKVCVVLLGQDPYHDEGQATGLAFSVPKGVQIPPSLKNMYKELETDIDGFVDPGHGCLEGWSDQGVLLLNTTLTVECKELNCSSF